jgi:Protein of unknown function (DUF2971)
MGGKRGRGSRKVPFATPTRLAKFEAELDRIVGDAAPPIPTKMPEVLYHYTTWPGFRGIVSNQYFFATAHHCTNDRAELTSIDATLTDIAEDLVRTVAPELRVPLNTFLRDLPTRKIAKQGTVYLACFSAARDSASQWHSYGNGGRGICLGLKILHDERLTDSRVATMPVVYDEGLWRETLRTKFQQVVSCHASLGRRYRTGYAKGNPGAWSALMRIAAIASLRAKGSAWSSEEEWRAVVLQWQHDEPRLVPKFQADGREYIELRLRDAPRRLAFAEILLGPRQELAADDAIAEARCALEAAGYTAEEMPPIIVSTVDL